MQLHLKHFLGSLPTDIENSISSGILPYLRTTHPEHLSKHSFSCSKGGEERSGTPVPGSQNTSYPHHLLKKWSSVSLHIMSGHNWQYYGNYVCSVTGVMFADHVLRKQESRLVQFQVCRQSKTLFLTVKQPYHKQSAALTKPCNGTMIRSLLSRFMSHFFSQLRNTFGSQKKTRNGFKWLIYTSSKLRCSAMRCNAFS